MLALQTCGNEHRIVAMAFSRPALASLLRVTRRVAMFLLAVLVLIDSVRLTPAADTCRDSFDEISTCHMTDGCGAPTDEQPDHDDEGGLGDRHHCHCKVPIVLTLHGPEQLPPAITGQLRRHWISDAVPEGLRTPPDPPPVRLT